METVKFHGSDSSRMDKIEEIFDTLGTTFSSIKTEKVETPAKREPKFVHVPKAPRSKSNPPIAKGVETVKTLEETPIVDEFINESSLDFYTFGILPRSISMRPLFERPLKTSCIIEELFDDLDDGSIDIT